MLPAYRPGCKLDGIINERHLLLGKPRHFETRLVGEHNRTRGRSGAEPKYASLPGSRRARTSNTSRNLIGSVFTRFPGLRSYMPHNIGNSTARPLRNQRFNSTNHISIGWADVSR